MDDILNELTKPVWWFSVFIAGLAVNILAAYIKPLFDHLTQRISSLSKERFEKYSALRQQRINSLIENPLEFANLKLDGIYALLVVGLSTLLYALFILTGHQYTLELGNLKYIFSNSILLIVILIFLFYEVRIVIDAEITIRAVRRELRKRASKSG